MTHHGGPLLALGGVQRSLLQALYDREQEELKRSLETGALTQAMIVEASLGRDDDQAVVIKEVRPRLEAPWSAVIRRLNPSGDVSSGNNLARVADALEKRGLIWIKPPRTSGHRRRKSCGLTDLGRTMVASGATRTSDSDGERSPFAWEFVEQHYRRWQARRTELESRLRDRDFVFRASDSDLADLQRQLTQARELQAFVTGDLLLIAEIHSRPDPPGESSAVLTVTGSTRESYGRADDETKGHAQAMLHDVVSRAMAAKRAARTSRILSPTLGADED